MSIENPMPKLSHSRGVLCVLKPHTAPYGAEAPSQRAAINMSLLWSKGMRFGYDVAFHLCLLPKPHNNSLMEPTATLTIFIIELTL